jgi:hypothetical protein
MLAGLVGLAVWDVERWRALLDDDGAARPARPAAPPLLDVALWRGCGIAVLGAYLLVCAITGEVYRPRGADFDQPAFYLLVALPLFPLVTLAVDQRRHRRARAPAAPGSRS